MIFPLEIWYRFNGGDDKDFFYREIEADTLEDAKKKAFQIKRSVFKVYQAESLIKKIV